MKNKLLALYGLKWNPFTADIPTEALWVTPETEHFSWRLEQLVRQGGFALITGDPGTGKSVSLRLLAQRLSETPDLLVGVLCRPQSHLADFYRELGDLFGVTLSAHNRWGGFKALREKWVAHLSTTLCRPVIFVDEAQELRPAVLSELRILSSTDFDSRSLLTVLLSGDSRLLEQLREKALLPIASRIRSRLSLEPKTPQQLLEFLQHSLAEAGNPCLMTPQLIATLSEHAAGNLRVLCSMADDLLAVAARREAPQIDEKLFLEVFAPPQRSQRRNTATASRTDLAEAHS